MLTVNNVRRLPVLVALSLFISLFAGVFVVHHNSLIILETLHNWPFVNPSVQLTKQFSVRKSSKFVTSLCNCSKEIQVLVDELSSPQSDEAFDWCSSVSSIRGKYQKVITYTLYGNTTDPVVFKRYYSYLSDIAVTAEKEYPGWNIRVYHNFSDDQTNSKSRERAAHDLLCDVYCKFPHVDLCSVPLMVKRIGHGNKYPIDPALLQRLNPKMLRYLVMLDPDVDIFISRDIDSAIWPREVDAVAEWLRSNYTFHLMRDSVSHGSIILAGNIFPKYFYCKFKVRNNNLGMWGAKVYQRRDLIEGLMRAIVLEGQNGYILQDQAALDRILWPVAQYDVVGSIQ